MASPVANGQPNTPPAADPSAPSTTLQPAPEAPLTSLTDTGDSKRPRDARLIHLVLSSLGVHSYQERVPLQLLDFAYRYTSSVLSDSLRLSADGYNAASGNQEGRRRGGGGGGEGNDGTITVTALRQAIASRTGYTFQSALPKEFMLEQANERNKVALPKVERGYGVQLPPEKYCLTGLGWNIREGWESEDEEVDDAKGAAKVANEDADADERWGGMDGAEDDEEEGAGRMEDVFGEGGDGDASMQE